MSFFKNISVAIIGLAIVGSMALTAHTFANISVATTVSACMSQR